MICIYDTVMTGNPDTFRRYGVNFRLEKRFRMGGKTFYSFIAPGMEKLLVIPTFAQQYREAEAKCIHFGTGKTLEAYTKLLKKHINSYLVVESMPSGDSEDGVMYVITASYKDIRISFEYLNKTLTISQEFEICENNLFGNGIVVLMNVDMEEA